MRAGEQADFWGAGSLAPGLVVSRQAGAAEIPPSRLPRPPAGPGKHQFPVFPYYFRGLVKAVTKAPAEEL